MFIAIPFTLQHVSVSIVCDGEQMRGHFVPSFALVLLDDTVTVDRQASVWVDSDAEQTRVRLKNKRDILFDTFLQTHSYTTVARCTAAALQLQHGGTMHPTAPQLHYGYASAATPCTVARSTSHYAIFNCSSVKYLNLPYLKNRRTC